MVKRQRDQSEMADQSGVDDVSVPDEEEWVLQFLNVDGGGGEAAEPEAEPKADCVLEEPLELLPVKAWRRILSFLPIKSVIRMSCLSSVWRELYLEWINDVSMDITLRSRDSLLPLMQRERECPLRRFSLIIESSDRFKVTKEDFDFCLDYAAKCSTEIIHIENRRSGQSRCFRFQKTSQQLVHLSLSGIRVGQLHDGEIFFPMLEVICMNSTTLSVGNLRLLVAACPLLRILELRGCKSINKIDVELAGANLMNLTVLDCDRVSLLNAGNLHLRSFRYRGRFLWPISLPVNNLLTDLYISIWTSTCPSVIPSNSFGHLPDLSNLTTLTLCSNSLRAMSCSNAIQRNFRSLTQLQLLMFKMEPINLSDICALLNTCRYPQLEKLFVQLPIEGSNSTQNAIPEEVMGEHQEGFEKLEVIKMTKFKYDDSIEIQLLQFLVNKANFLQKLILVCPEPLPEACHLPLQAPENVKITVSASDDSALESFHSELVAKE